METVKMLIPVWDLFHWFITIY